MAACILDQRTGRVETHRLRVEDRRGEFGRVVVLEVRARVHEQREARRVRLGEAVVGEGVYLAVDPARRVLGDSVASHPVDELLADRRHPLAAALVPHRPAQRVGLAGGEAGRLDRHAHPLLLEERNAERALEDGFELRVRIGHLLLARAPAQIRVHHLPLDRSRPDERHFHDEIVEAARLQPRERVHLRAALHLEDAYCIGATEVVVHCLVGVVELRNIHRDAAHLADVAHAVLQEGEHAEAEEVYLDHPHRLDVVLLPLDDGAVGHGGRLDRYDRVQRFLREHEAAHVD